MKHFLLSISLLFTLSIHAQEVNKALKAKHSFYLSGGLFGQNGTTDIYTGFSSSLVYQIYFPNRFIFGIEFLTDQSFFREKGSKFSPTISRFSGISPGIQLGVHIIRKKHFDFSMLLDAHFNYQEYFIEIHETDSDVYEVLKRKTGFIFVPILSYRAEFYYKINQLHGIGLLTDVNVDMEWDGFEDLLNTELIIIGRVMLSYRFTLPSK